MAQITSQLLASQQVHPSDSSVQTYTGDRVKASAYYGNADGRHTVQLSLTGFIGKIRIEGTLATSPGSTDWAIIELGTGVSSLDTTGSISAENITYVEYTDPTTVNKSYNFTGNFVWVRAYVYDWTDGTVNSIRVNY
jgi:hypothetical protein